MADTPSNFDPFQELPEPAARADAKEDYARKADALNAALYKLAKRLNVFVAWLNALIAWIVTTRTDMATSQDAAAQSVKDAAGQVKLATDQALASKGSADSAANTYGSMQVLAGALQSAAGIPAMAGKLGHFLQIGADGVVRWWPLQKVGDSVTALAPPDASWIPDNARYSQSLYPELFAKVGYAALDDTANQSKYIPTIPIGSNTSYGQAAIGDNGVIVYAGYSGYLFRSTDYGVTWNTSSTAFYLGGKNGNAVAYDPLEKVFIAVSAQGGCWRSTDQGLTWTYIALPNNWSGWNMANITNAGRKAFAITSISDPNNIMTTTDGGLNWVMKAAPSSVKWISWDGTYLYASQVNAVHRSANLGTTWETFNVPAPYTGGGQVGGPITVGKVASNGKSLIFAIDYTYQIGNSVYRHYGFYMSMDKLNTLVWLPVSPLNTINDNAKNMTPGDLSLDQFGVALMPESIRTNTLWRISNVGVAGKTPLVEQYYTQAGGYAGWSVTTDNMGFWLLGFGNQMKRITPAYDPKTFFALPRVTPCEPPFNNYVKAKTI